MQWHGRFPDALLRQACLLLSCLLSWPGLCLPAQPPLMKPEHRTAEGASQRVGCDGANQIPRMRGP